jgi:hypothetical protein
VITDERNAARNHRKQFAASDHVCASCHQNAASVWHHVKPVAHGGVTADDNLIPLCAYCHYVTHYGDNGDADWQVRNAERGGAKTALRLHWIFNKNLRQFQNMSAGELRQWQAKYIKKLLAGGYKHLRRKFES